jgi:cation transport regulator
MNQKNNIMLYKSNQDLPLEIRDRFPEAYQDIYRAAFNSAVHWYGEATKAHQVALSAVKMQSAMDKKALV